MELLTPRINLRDFRETDFASFRKLETHPATYHFEPACPDEPATRKYLENALADARQTPRTRYRFAVTMPPTDEVLGRVTLSLQNDSIREWEIGWAIHPDYWGRGFATEAARRLLGFAFADLHVHRVVAFSHVGNVASIRVMERLGMCRDGLLRETRQWQGGWADEVVFSILEREWR